MTLSDFEKQLKQFAPEEPSTDVGELFYQCGWNAREAANAPANKKNVRRQLPTFLVGMACGLMASVGVFLWQPSVENGQPAMVDVEREAGAVERAVVESDIESADAPKQVITTETGIKSSEWQIDDMFTGHRLAMANNSPLSFAARARWSRQLQSVRQSSASDSGAASSFPDDNEPLRAGPINKKLLQQLFL